MENNPLSSASNKRDSNFFKKQLKNGRAWFSLEQCVHANHELFPIAPQQFLAGKKSRIKTIKKQ